MAERLGTALKQCLFSPTARKEHELWKISTLKGSGLSTEKEPACNVGDLGFPIPGLGRSPKKGMATYSSKVYQIEQEFTDLATMALISPQLVSPLEAAHPVL